MNYVKKWLGIQLIAVASLAGVGASDVAALDECPKPWGAKFFVACYPTPAWCWNTVDQETNACADFGCLEDQEHCPGSSGQVALWGVSLEYQNMP